MKRTFLYIISGLCALAAASCALKEDRAYDQTPDERLIQVMTEYSRALNSAPSGWLMTVNTGISGGYQLYLSFNDRERVIMLCDMDATFATEVATSAVPNESSYQLKALQMPTLIFDTYNYLHLMADPQGSVNGGTNGTGLKSDFEFDMLSFDSGTFTLRGTYNKCTAYLRRATPEEAQAAMDGELKAVFERLKHYTSEVKVPIVEIGGQPVALQLTGRTVVFSWMEPGSQSPRSVTAGSWMSIDDPSSPVPERIELFAPADVLGKKIVRLVWNGEHYDAQDEQGERYPGSDHLTPIFPLVLGADQLYSTMTFTTPGEFAETVSQAYLNTYYTPAEELYTAWKRKITYIKCLFTNNSEGRSVLRVYAGSQTPPSATIYQAGWDIDYTLNEDGTYTFSNREAGGDSGNITNARNYGQKMRGMLDIFSKVVYSKYVYTSSTNFEIEVESVEPHTFRLEWLTSRTPGLEGQLGAFVQVDNPDMYFCGILSK